MRYVNPGFFEWLPVILSNTSGGNISDATKSKTGTAFSNSYYGNYIPLPYGEFWCKFDFYAVTNSYFYIGEFRNNTTIYNAIILRLTSSGKFGVEVYVKNSSNTFVAETNYQEYGIKINAINSALIHWKWADTENGFFNVQINDRVLGSFESANLIPFDSSVIKFFLYNNGNQNAPISNVIISDEPISIKEQIVALPISGVETDMTYDSETGIYTASAANQSLLASVNVADLISDFGSDSKVTGVTIAGNPAYRTAEGLSSFTALTKKNNTVTEYGAANIPADSDSVVANSFKVASDTTIADLQIMQLGLKVGG